MTAATTDVSVPELDLSSVLEILVDAGQDLASLNGEPLTSNRKEEAERNRRLLRLADSLGLASCLVRNEYWHSRGRPSYDL